MPRPAYSLCFLAFCCAQVLAKAVTPDTSDQYCVYAIYSSFSSYTFSDGSLVRSDSTNLAGRSVASPTLNEYSYSDGWSGDRFQADRSLSVRSKGLSTPCTVTSGVMSIYASSNLYCTAAEITSGFDYIRKTCEMSGTKMISLDNITATATDSYISSLQVVDPSTLSTKTSITHAVVLSQHYYKLAIRSLKDSARRNPTDDSYGYALSGFWAIVLVFGMANNLWRVLSERRFAAGKNNRTTLPALATTQHWYRTYIKVPAAFRSYHRRSFFWFTVPTRLESFVVFSWWALNIILSCVTIDAFEGNTSGLSVSNQVWKYVAHRTGQLSTAALPWIWMFAGRNNIFIWATGWNFGSFNVFHRHIARAAMVQAIVHSIAYTVLYTKYTPGRYEQSLSAQWFVLGIVAIVSMCVLVFLASTWIRRKWYELFLVSHIVLSIVVIYALFRHTSHVGGYFPYLWSLVAIWGFDRFLRVFRIAYCNLNVRFSGSPMSSTSATISYKKETAVLRIELQPCSKLLRPGPGQHYFLYQPRSLQGWENHPFTLGAYSSTSPPSKQLKIAEKDADIEVNTSSASSSSDYETSSSENKFVFWVRPYDGWTKRIRDRCLKSADGVLRPTILLEGPYGHSSPVFAYDTVLMITAGTGIAAAVPYILDHIERSSSGKTKCADMRLHWAARQPEFFKDVCSQELAPALTRPDFSASFYATGGSTVASSSSADISPVEEKPGFSSKSATDIDMQSGRPDVRALVLGAAEEVTAASVRLAVLVCGPAAIADEARASVVEAMKQGCRTIEYFEEAYGW